jgi:hypothetical protein
MFVLVVDFANLLLAALVVGGLFGVRLFLNPTGLGASLYVAVQQQAIRTMNTVMPALGAATILVTVAAAVLGRDDRVRLCLLVVTAACFLAIGLITRFLNQPINAMVMTWCGDSAPSNWTVLRDEWWHWHLMRLATGLVGLSLLIAAALRRG